MLNEILRELFKHVVSRGLENLDDILSHPGETEAERSARRKREKLERQRERAEAARNHQLRQLEIKAEKRRIAWEYKKLEMKTKKYWYKFGIRALAVLMFFGMLPLAIPYGEALILYILFLAIVLFILAAMIK